MPCSSSSASCERNTFASGLNRELAFDYHGLVTELGLLGILEAAASGHPLSTETWQDVCRMIDVVAAVLDERSRAPRQGDSDDGRALVLDAPEANRWASLLASGAAVFGAARGGRPSTPGVTSAALGVLCARCARRRRTDRRGARRTSPTPA